MLFLCAVVALFCFVVFSLVEREPLVGDVENANNASHCKSFY